MQIKILFIDSIHNVLIKKLVTANFICDYKPTILLQEIENIIANYDGIILRNKIIIDKNIIDRAVKLKFIGRVGSGLENIDVAYASEKKIKCFNSPEGNCNAVGEHAIGMLLSLFHNINISNYELRSGIWNREKNRGIELNNITIGIIGYGNTGSAFAKKLKGFNVKILAYDKYKSNYTSENVIETNMEDIFNNSDILSLHIPLTNENEYLVNDEFINKFKNNIYIINTSRGKVIDTSDLIKNLKTNKVKGACLDVMEYESHTFENLFNNKNSEDFNYLCKANNVILTPHIAGLTKESKYKTAAVLAEKIIENYNSIL